MKILRDDRTVALGEVIVACHQVAEVCETAADAASHAAVAGALRELAADRLDVADTLHRQSARQLGEMPSDSEPEERTLLRKAATRLSGLMTEPAEEGLLESCREQEDRLIAAIDAALRHFPEGDLRERLVALRRDCEVRFGRIAAIRDAAEAPQARGRDRR